MTIKEPLTPEESEILRRMVSRNIFHMRKTQSPTVTEAVTWLQQLQDKLAVNAKRRPK